MLGHPQSHISDPFKEEFWFSNWAEVVSLQTFCEEVDSQRYKQSLHFRVERFLLRLCCSGYAPPNISTRECAASKTKSGVCYGSAACFEPLQLHLDRDLEGNSPVLILYNNAYMGNAPILRKS